MAGGFGSVFWCSGFSKLAIGYLIGKGVGIWGINIPIGWGFAIVNFVWWIGIGHAGTLISAILFLLNQKWRTSINSVCAKREHCSPWLCAGTFPAYPYRSAWYGFWMFPYPSVMGIGRQFRSPSSGTCSPYLPTLRFLCSSGLRLDPDLATLCAIHEQGQAGHLRNVGLGGAILLAIGSGISPLTCFWRLGDCRWCSLFTQL